MRAIMIMLCIALLAGCAGRHPAHEAPSRQAVKPADPGVAKAANTEHTVQKAHYTDVLGVLTSAETTYTEKIFRDLTPGYYSYFKASNTSKPFIVFKTKDGRAGFATETSQGLTYITADVRMQSADFVVFSKSTVQPVTPRIKSLYDTAKLTAAKTAAKEIQVRVVNAVRAKQSGPAKPGATAPAGATPAAAEGRQPLEVTPPAAAGLGAPQHPANAP